MGGVVWRMAAIYPKENGVRNGQECWGGFVWEGR